MHTEQKIILAADDFSRENLLDFVKKAGPRVYGVKIHSLYDLYGPQIVSELKQAGALKVWVDAKLHDIPNTVRLRAKAISAAGADILSVHATGGLEMMQAAKDGFGSGTVFGITALTSLTDQAVRNIYGCVDAKDLVARLVPLIKRSGIIGLVCSVNELGVIRSNPEYDSLVLAVPGIRSAGVDANDQKRFDTPANAIKAGANFLVIGRQLTQSSDVLVALDQLEAELKLAI